LLGLNVSDDELQMLSLIWGDDCLGAAKPLFGIRTTNGIEGENNAMLYNDMRNQTVPQAIVTFISCCSEIWGNLKKYCKKLMSQNATICKNSQTIIEKEHIQSNNYRVLKCNSSGVLYNVKYAGKSSLVDIMQKTCPSCVIRHQMDLPLSS
jgi:hypothetical protein